MSEWQLIRDLHEVSLGDVGLVIMLIVGGWCVLRLMGKLSSLGDAFLRLNGAKDRQ